MSDDPGGAVWTLWSGLPARDDALGIDKPGSMRSQKATLLTSVGVICAAALVLTSCGSEDASQDTVDTGDEPTATTDRADAVATGRAVRVFDVDGVEVVVTTDTADLPERASMVEFSGTLIDSGSGPEICFGAALESQPPQCAGVVVDGLDMSAWADQAQDVYWGDRSVTVTWPPVNNHVQLLEDAPPERIDFRNPSQELPEVCRSIARFVSVEVVNDYARNLGERNGGLYLANSGELVLQVTDDPEQHRQALATGDSEACVVQSTWSETELDQILHSLYPQVYELIPYQVGTGSAELGRVAIEIAVADRDTVRKIAALVNNPETLRVIGLATLIDDR